MLRGAVHGRHVVGVELNQISPTRYDRKLLRFTSPDLYTSNRDVEEWHPLFGDALLASAAMDRLLHNAHVVVMDGDTYRNPPPAKKARRGNGRPAAG